MAINWNPTFRCVFVSLHLKNCVVSSRQPIHCDISQRPLLPFLRWLEQTDVQVDFQISFICTGMLLILRNLTEFTLVSSISSVLNAKFQDTRRSFYAFLCKKKRRYPFILSSVSMFVLLMHQTILNKIYSKSFLRSENPTILTLS